VQVATKFTVQYKDIKELISSVRWKGQLTFYISCATIKHRNVFEAGTVPPEERFTSFTLNEIFPFYLYIKPVIQDVTLLDLPTFSEVIKKHGIGAVVGSRFQACTSPVIAPIGNEKLFTLSSSDEEIISSGLFGVGAVFRESVQAVDFWRNK
jgi:DNA repair photolyase